jgi:predicted O-linked N-acetylglucosamine transferase (SPINDLY family)
MTTTDTLQFATAHHRAGRLNEAESLYRQAIAADPQNPEPLHRLAILELQRKQAPAALNLISRAIELNPKVAFYHWTLGQACASMRRWDAAMAAYGRTLELKENYPEVYFDLGIALAATNQPDQAIKAYRRALALRPDYVEARLNLGNVFHSQGRAQEAADAYKQVLVLRPDSAEAHNNLGNALQRLGQMEQAIEEFRRALSISPDHIHALSNLGGILCTVGRNEEAIKFLGRAHQLRPDFPEAAYNLGNAFWAIGNWDAAVKAFRRAIAAKPDHAAAHNNLGNVLKAIGKVKEAEAEYRQGLKYQPNYVEAHSNLGSVLRMQGRTDEAVESYRQALAIRPDLFTVHSNLGNVYKDMGEIQEAIACYRRAAELAPGEPIVQSNLAYALHFCDGVDAMAILAENRHWNERYAAPLASEIRVHDNDRSPDRRLRVGYISPDFRHHCQAFFTIPLLGHHDHQQFEIFCYGNVARPDAITERLRGFSDNWRSTVAQSDQQVAEQVRADGIDILVDLTMHMAHNRPLTFARKPAPVQIAWLAYPGTTGIAAIDYRLTDPYLDPPGRHDEHYSERSIRLPETFWCYDPLTDGPPINDLPAQSAAHVTFGCLNNLCKFNDRTLNLWTRVLGAMPHSRLVMLAPHGSYRQQMLAKFAMAGIEAHRIELVPRQPRERYLQTYHRIDLGLDTIPYNGHTTSLDSYWMGVPVVTLVGDKAVGRAGLSQLTNLNMTELVAHSEEEYVKISLGLANDVPRMAKLRSTLRGAMRKSPLMDAPRFAKNIESAYRHLWERWCAGGV